MNSIIKNIKTHIITIHIIFNTVIYYKSYINYNYHKIIKICTIYLLIMFNFRTNNLK